jgi:hypothetical protein
MKTQQRNESELRRIIGRFSHGCEHPYNHVGGSSRLTNLHRQHGNNLPLNGDTVSGAVFSRRLAVSNNDLIT